MNSMAAAFYDCAELMHATAHALVQTSLRTWGML